MSQQQPPDRDETDRETATDGREAADRSVGSGPSRDSDGGENYGWNVMEASACFEPAEGCDASGLTLPIIVYPHGGEWGRSVSGGYVYRGPSAGSLEGAYVFGDYVSGRIWTARAENAWQPELLLESGFRISTFGVGADGELYAADHAGGAIYLLTP